MQLVILCCLWKKGLQDKQEISDAEGSRTVSGHVAQNWFRCFKEGDASLEDKPRLGRPSVVEDEALFDMVEQQPSTNTCTLLEELCPSQYTIN